MLRQIIVFCLSRRPLVLIAYVALLGLGFVAFTALNIEAYPDPAPPIIEIIAQRPGQSPEEMERYVTRSRSPWRARRGCDSFARTRYMR